jgi:hypothetical protein
VCRGTGPAAYENEASTKKLLGLIDKVKDVEGTTHTRKRGFAADWWTEQFKLMDYLPKCAFSLGGWGHAPVRVIGLGLGLG